MSSEHNCSCGHNHEHEHHPHHEPDCSCGHDHHHEHEYHHDHDCSCGHDHHHEHEHHHGHEHHHEHDCSCSHDHHHEHHHEAKETASLHKKIYNIENLGCAHCAAKMEAQIRTLPGVEDAVLTYATKQLKLYTDSDDIDYLNDIQNICASIEEEVIVTERKSRPRYNESQETRAENTVGDKTVIICGILLFALGLLTERIGLSLIPFIIFIAGYLLLGFKIVRTAFRNLANGRIFDENFLMSTATIAAFCIGDFAEAVGVMLFYRIGEYFEDMAVEKSRRQIMSAIDMRPEVVHLVNGDETITIPAEDALPGDIILIRPGDRIPLDGTVTDGESRIDTSPVTGEPVPVAARPGTALLSGCINTSGLLKMQIEKTLDESMVTKILDSVENAAATKPVIDRFITRFAAVYTPAVVVLAVATAILPSLFTGDWKHWIYTAITFLVISCPCALVLSVPLAFFSGIGAGSKKGILFKGGASIEAIAKIKAVVMDKTGTITKGEFAVQTVVPAAGISEELLLSYAASCENSSTHPIAQSILAAAEKQGIHWDTPDSLEEFSGKGIRAIIESHTLLCGSRKLMETFHIELPEQAETITGTEVLLACDNKYMGHIIISDAIKPDSAAAIRNLKAQHLKTVMLTGDSEATADAVASAVGIDETHARLLPDEKLQKLQTVRVQTGAVMFVGDGINDAPVLANADVGAAMGSGADAAIEAADIVFMNSNMSSVPEAIRISKITQRIAWQNVIFALAVKLLVMVLGLMGIASMWLAVFAYTGVAMICVLNAIRILYIFDK